jgi:hypothetical protein
VIRLIPEVPRAGQRSAGAVVVGVAEHSLSLPVGRQNADVVRLAADQICNVISILKNPFYGGVYAYGKSEKRTAIIDGRARKSYGHRKPMDTWEVFIKDHQN